MLTLLRKGKYRLTDETLELEARKEYRERTGVRNPRPNRFTDAAPKKGNQQHGSVCFMYSNATVTPPLLYMNSVDYDSDTSAATCGLTCEDSTTAFPAIPEAMSLTRDVKLPADPKEEIPSSDIALNQTMAAQMHARHSLQRLDDNLSRLEKMVAMMLKAEGVQTPAELRNNLQERVERADNTAAASYKLERLERAESAAEPERRNLAAHEITCAHHAWEDSGPCSVRVQEVRRRHRQEPEQTRQRTVDTRFRKRACRVQTRW